MTTINTFDCARHHDTLTELFHCTDCATLIDAYDYCAECDDSLDYCTHEDS